MYYEMFERLCSEKKVRPADVSRATGISTATLTSWKKGTYTPKIDKLQAIADYFEVPLETITGKTQNFEIISKFITAKPDPAQLVKTEEILQGIMQSIRDTIPEGTPVYYENETTAKEAQEMYEDADLRALYHMKKKMDPEKFAAHMKWMKELYRLEHPEEFPEDNE